MRFWQNPRTGLYEPLPMRLCSWVNAGMMMGGGSPVLPILTVAGVTANGTNSNNIAVASLTIPAGSLIIVAVATGANVTLSSISDGHNTYTIDDNGVGNPCAAIASVANCVALSSATVTATFSGTTGATARGIVVYWVANAALTSPLDKKATATGTSASPTVTTAATTVNNTVVIGAIGLTSNSGSITIDANYTNDGAGSVTTTIGHKTTNPSSKAAQTFAPSIPGSLTWRCLCAAYKGLS